MAPTDMYVWKLGSSAGWETVEPLGYEVQLGEVVTGEVGLKM